MQSLYFCQLLDVRLTLFIPESAHFMMYFDFDAVAVKLDRSYLTSAETARQRALDMADKAGVEASLLETKSRTARDMPDLPVHFAFMACPRSISDVTSKIGLGYIGPKVRRIIRSAQFPVLMTAPVFKPWKSVAVLFGGSDSAVNALRSGIRVAERTGFPLDLFIQMENDTSYYDERIEAAGLTKDFERVCRERYLFDSGRFQDNLYTLPHDALVYSGAYGHGLINNLLFGSKMEISQTTLTNPMMVCGPNTKINLN